MKGVFLGLPLGAITTSVAFAQATPNSPTPSGIAPGGGLGIPQAMGNNVPPSFFGGTAGTPQVPPWSAIGQIVFQG